MTGRRQVLTSQQISLSEAAFRRQGGGFMALYDYGHFWHLQRYLDCKAEMRRQWRRERVKSLCKYKVFKVSNFNDTADGMEEVVQ